MKKKLVIVALIVAFLVFILKPVSAGYKGEIFDGWVYGDSSFNASGKEFYVVINGRLSLVSIKHGEDTAIVGIVECKDAFGFNFCFDEQKIWYHDALDRDYYQAKMKVYEYLGKIAVNRTFSNTDLLINERVRVDALIENTGSLPATNIEFTDPYPAEFLITDNENCVISGNSIKWRGNIDAGSKIRCSYYIIPQKKIDYKSRASAKYYNGRMIKTDYSSIVRLNVPDYRLGINSSLSRKEIDLEEETTLYLNLTNLHKSHELTVLNLKINIPLGLEVVNKGPLLSKKEGYLSMTGISFLAESSRDTYITFRGKRSGFHPITANVRYEINNVIQEFNINLTKINVTLKDLQLFMHIPSVMKADGSYRINISAKNPSDSYEYKNIRTYLKTDVPGLEEKDFGVINWLEKGGQQGIAHYIFTILPTKGRKTHYVTLEAYYLTLNGEYLKQRITRNIEIIGEQAFINETGVNETAAGNASTLVGEGSLNQTSISAAVKAEKAKAPTSSMIIIVIVVFILVDVFLIASIIKKVKKA